MKRTLIRYTTSTAMADKNAELIANVFVELKAAKPEGVRYLSLRLDDDTFIHLVETEAGDGSSALPNRSRSSVARWAASGGSSRIRPAPASISMGKLPILCAILARPAEQKGLAIRD